MTPSDYGSLTKNQQVGGKINLGTSRCIRGWAGALEDGSDLVVGQHAVTGQLACLRPDPGNRRDLHDPAFDTPIEQLAQVGMDAVRLIGCATLDRTVHKFQNVGALHVSNIALFMYGDEFTLQDALCFLPATISRARILSDEILAYLLYVGAELPPQTGSSLLAFAPRCGTQAGKGGRVPIPDYQTLMLPVLKLAAEGDWRVPKAADRIADQFGLTVEEREASLPSGRQRLLHNRIHWAKLYMTRAGLIESPQRGVFRASDEGRALLAKKLTSIDNEALKAYPSFVEFQRAGSAGQAKVEKPVAEAASVSSGTPEEQIDAAQAVLHSALSGELLQRILDNSPLFFEQLIVDLLVAMGYGGSHQNAALKLGKSGDNGVDGVIDEDRLGLDRIYVQAKRYAATNSVQRPEVQGFVGSLVGFGATKGVFVTTSSFSAGAQQYANQIPQRVILIDGARLTDLMIEHDVGVRVSRAIKVKRIDEDFFGEG